MSDTLHFTVSGEWLTQFARERYKETKDKQVGINFLTGSLIGFPEDLALQVITGKKKLVGDNEVIIEEDNAVVRPYGIIHPTDIVNSLCGWISPTGDVYGVNKYTQTTEHDDLAREIVVAELVEDNQPSYYRDVEKAGWIKFSPHLAASCAKASEITQFHKTLLMTYMITHDISLLQIGFGLAPRIFNVNQIRQMDLLQFGIYLTGNN